MLRLWQRTHDFLLPFKCTFAIATPIRVDLQKKPRLPPELPLEIWLEIFQFATYVHHDITIAPLDPFTPKHMVTNAMGVNTPSLAMRTKLALVLVSKGWRRIAVQILYQTLSIRSPARANVILQTLEHSRLPVTSPSELEVPPSPGYGQYVRHVVVLTFTRGSKDIQYLQLVFRILRLCPNLRILSGRWIHTLPVEFLNALSKLLGPSLSELYWSERQRLGNLYTLTDPAFLGTFQALRVLDLRDFVGNLSLSWPQSKPKPTLPLVQNLILSSTSTSLEAATLIFMPSLRSLTLRHSTWDDVLEELLTTFLQSHGQSLVIVDLPTHYIDSEPDPSISGLLSRRTGTGINPDIFLAPDVCPNLEALVFPTSSPPIQPHTHPNLRRIGLRGVNVDGLYPDKTSSTKDHLIAINVDKYPNLEFIQTVEFLVEAHADSLIKDVFIWWVERFEAMGVLFVDGEGVMWAYQETPSESDANSQRPQNNSVTALMKMAPGEELKQQFKENKKSKHEIDEC